MPGTAVSTERLLPDSTRGRAREVPPSARARFAGARLARGAAPLRPRGVGSLLDLGLDVLVDRFGICVGIGVLCWLPFQIGSELLRRSGTSEEAEVVLSLLLSVASVVPQSLTTAFVCIVVAGHVLGRGVSPGEAVRTGLLRLPGILVLAVLQFLGTVLLLCACIAPGLLAPWLFAVVPIVYVLERGARGSSSAPGRFARWASAISLALTRGVKLVLGWDSLGRYLGIFLVAFVVITGPLSAVTGGLSTPEVRDFLDDVLGLSGGPVELSLSVVMAAFVAIGTAYTAILATVYYLDQRVRKEGLDLELALARIEERARERR